MRTLDDPPPSPLRCGVRRTQEDGASSSLVDDCSPWISSLWRIYPKERGGGRELESLGDTSSSNRNPTVYYPLGYDQFRPAQLFHPLVILFFYQCSSSSRRLFEEFFERRSSLPRFYLGVSLRNGWGDRIPPIAGESVPFFRKEDPDKICRS